MSFEESKQQDGVRVNHYEVAIESVKSIEAILVKLGANPHGKASDKLKDVCAIFRKKYKFTFPQTLRNEIRSIFQYGNRIRHDPNCKKIEDCFDFASKMCSINFGFRLIFDAIAKGDASFEFALNKNYNYHQTDICETDPNLERKCERIGNYRNIGHKPNWRGRTILVSVAGGPVYTTFRLPPVATIHSVKHELARKTGIAIDRQRLSFEGAILDDKEMVRLKANKERNTLRLELTCTAAPYIHLIYDYDNMSEFSRSLRRKIGGIPRHISVYPSGQFEPNDSLVCIFGRPFYNRLLRSGGSARIWGIGDVTPLKISHVPKSDLTPWKEIVGRGFAINAGTGWVATMSLNHICVFKPIDGGQCFQLMTQYTFTDEQQLTGRARDLTHSRIRWPSYNDDIFVWSFSRSCIYSFKFRHCSLVLSNVIKDKYFKDAAVMDIAIFSNLLIILH
eukprot:293388_1